MMMKASLLLLLLLLILSFFNLLPLWHAEGNNIGARVSFAKWRKMGLGSRPPQCVNKCLGCKPCMATLVISSRDQKEQRGPTTHDGDGDGDDGYYLVSWKCACGKKIFQP